MKVVAAETDSLDWVRLALMAVAMVRSTLTTENCLWIGDSKGYPALAKLARDTSERQRGKLGPIAQTRTQKRQVGRT